MKYFLLGTLTLSSLLFGRSSDLQANLFNCKGRGIQVDYSASSLIGQPQMNVKFTKGHRIEYAAGVKGVESESVHFGEVVSSTYVAESMADGPTYHFSLVIPFHELGAKRSMTLDTHVVVSTVVSPFRPHGVEFQVQHNQVLPVKCVAQFVNF